MNIHFEHSFKLHSGKAYQFLAKLKGKRKYAGKASARKEKQMKYRIDYGNGQHSRVISNRDELLKLLKKNANAVIDIVKLYNSGVSDSVREKYEKYLKSPYQSRKLQ